MVVQRKSSESSVTIPDRESTKALMKRVEDALQGKATYTVNRVSNAAEMCRNIMCSLNPASLPHPKLVRFNLRMCLKSTFRLPPLHFQSTEVFSTRQIFRIFVYAFTHLHMRVTNPAHNIFLDVINLRTYNLLNTYYNDHHLVYYSPLPLPLTWVHLPSPTQRLQTPQSTGSFPFPPTTKDQVPYPI
jgi:hypothetical protein